MYTENIMFLLTGLSCGNVVSCKLIHNNQSRQPAFVNNLIGLTVENCIEMRPTWTHFVFVPVCYNSFWTFLKKKGKNITHLSDLIFTSQNKGERAQKTRLEKTF